MSDEELPCHLKAQTEEKAYHIWEKRKASDIWEYGNLGTKEGDFIQAEREIYGRENLKDT